MTWIDLRGHPIHDPVYRANCATTLDEHGALVLERFFTHDFVRTVLEDSAEREADAYFANDTHNIWLTPPDSDLPGDHIFNRQIVSTKGLLADDQLSTDSPLRAVYDEALFRSFIAAVVGVEAVHPYADMVSSINVHFHRDGEELGWHFDNSSFAVTTLIQAPQDGGVFEYVPGARSTNDDIECYDRVTAAVDHGTGARTLSFAPGDLVVFRGRNSMHRVTPSRGTRTRILVVFAFNTEPNIGLSASALETFYGRT